MEYHEAVNRLERLRRLRPKLGLETTRSLLESLGEPQVDLPVVQVAGSNGKGSTARVLERVLREAGLDVGLYTSPDLNDLRERVRVRGQKIPKHELTRFVETVWPEVVDRSVAGEEPTFFEAFTVLALWYFDRADVDVAVLEVGIGGRYDATSVVDPVASAVTSVSLEHTDILGDTVEEIARDKAHVAPAERPLVTGATGAALDAIRADHEVVTVGPEEADVHASEGAVVSPTASRLSLVGRDWAVETRTPLPGAHMATNAGIAATLARQVGEALAVDVTEADVAAGVRNVHAPGRFEVMDRAPLTVLDGAHNPDACGKLATTLDRLEYDRLHLVFGAMREKDLPAMCRALPPVDEAYLAAPTVERARGTDTLSAVFERETDAGIATHGSVVEALETARWTATEDDCVLVTGSLHTVAEARDHWTRAPRVVDTDTPAAARATLGSADVPGSVRTTRADAMVGRTLRFHARREVAADLTETMFSLGGSGAVSGIEAAAQHVEVVLSGSLDQFRDLVSRFRGRPGGRRLAAGVNRALGIGTLDPDGDYPWHDGTAVMGILNATPDSFHDGGEYDTVDRAVAHAERMVAEGAAIVDVGGESTRPGADPVSASEERERVVPVVERLADHDTFLSVDTRKPSVAEAALDAGADMVNDVTGLADAAMRDVVAAHDVPVVVMHSLSAPVDPHHRYGYDDVVDDVIERLTERVLLAERAGIDRSNLLLDPGLGFGKRAAESFELLDRLEEFRALGTPVMVGHSHKSMFEAVGCGPEERLAPTVAATALAAERGADIVRVHDVADNVAAVETARQMRQMGVE